jgi:hypothetical protein
MGLFDKIFGKKENKSAAEPQAETQKVQLQEGDVFVSVGDNLGFKVLRKLTEEQKGKMATATIPVMVAQLYMHYWTDDLVCEDPNDQSWQNQVVFFWKADEPFPKKSLPPIFETFKVKNFVFVDNSLNIALKVGQAMPWFGMPGLGEKHFCELNNQKVTIPELYKLGVVEYIEPVELTNDNVEILTDRENHFFLVDERIAQFKNNNFYLQDKIVPIEIAYSVGGLHIVKKVALQ